MRINFGIQMKMKDHPRAYSVPCARRGLGDLPPLIGHIWRLCSKRRVWGILPPTNVGTDVIERV